MKTKTLSLVPILMVGITLWMMITPSSSVITSGEGDPSRYTTPPKDAVRPWQSIVYFGEYIATCVSARQIITAIHIGSDSDNVVTYLNDGRKVRRLQSPKNMPAVGQQFRHHGIDYTIIAEQRNTSGNDIVVYTVDKDLPYWTEPVGPNHDTNIVGLPIFVVGRGQQRGEEVWGLGLQKIFTTNQTDLRMLAASNGVSFGSMKKTAQEMFPDAFFSGKFMFTTEESVVTNNVLKGWWFGPRDGVVRWGRNEIYDRIRIGNLNLLVAAFNKDKGPDECYIAFGDSGGPCFAKIDGVWKLLGINYGIDAVPAYERGGSISYGAIWDISGFWNGDYQYPIGHEDPRRFYVSDLSAPGVADWLASILIQPRK